MSRKDFKYYEAVEFTLSASASDVDLDATQSDFLSKFGPGNGKEYATQVEITTDNTIEVKLNDIGDTARTITSAESPKLIIGIPIRNMFLSSTPGANVKLWFQDNQFASDN